MEVPPVSVSSGRNLGKKLFPYIHDNVIGQNTTFQSKFGWRQVIYCDYTASGRPLSFIEDYLKNNVQPVYANTHTTTGVTSRQTSYYFQEARDIIRNAVNASSKDSVLFAGNGCTGAVHKIVASLSQKWKEDPLQPVVFTCPFAHHSAVLPFREAGYQVVRIGETKDGSMDLQELEDKLEALERPRHIIGCFAAASNVTGQLVDTVQLSVVMHRHGGLAFFDYATAAPYVKIDMNPVTSDDINHHLAYKDAVFISPHKFVGGVDSAGVLIAKTSLFSTHSPSLPGGGSVLFVTRSTHTYLSDSEHREEAGTPNVLACIRAGLAFQLKEAVGPQAILEAEHNYRSRVHDALSANPNIMLLGNQDAECLPIFSFLVRHPATGRFLHYNYVSTLLNDLFGIQTRSGCMCAGPYALDLLGIDENVAMSFAKFVAEDNGLDTLELRRYHMYSRNGILRPGFTRFNIPYFMTEEEVDFVIKAMLMVAEHGWKLLPRYQFDVHTGQWRVHDDPNPRIRLSAISYASGEMTSPAPTHIASPGKAISLKECLAEASKIFGKALIHQEAIADQRLVLPEEGEELRWFVLPSEVLSAVRTGRATPCCNPIDPGTYMQAVCSPSSECTHINRHTLEQPQQQLEQPQEQRRQQQSETETEPKPDAAEATSTSRDSGLEEDRRLGNNCGCGIDTPIDLLVSWSLKRGKRREKDDCPTCGRDLSSPFRDGGRAPTEEEAAATAATVSGPKKSKVSPPRKSVNLVCKLRPRKVKGAVSMPDLGNTPAKPKFVPPPKKIFKLVLKALYDFSMIKDGDRVMVALSGGKDSLSLLHTLHQYQFVARNKGIEFELGAVTIDPQADSYDPSPLKAYLAGLGVPYFYEEQGIMAKATELGEECTSICSFCSRMKRGRLYSAMRREKYNVLAMGQHLDDLCESFLMSCFHNGYLRTMKANYTVREGDLRVIRPLVYVREEMLRHFAEMAKFPVITENCPACFDAPEERHRVKRLLAEQEVIFPRLYQSLQAALHPLMSKNMCGLERKAVNGVHKNGLPQDAAALDDDE